MYERSQSVLPKLSWRPFGSQAARRAGRLLWLLVIAISVAVSAGCQKQDSPQADESETGKRMQKLGFLLYDFIEVAKHDKAGQPNEQGFKAYLAGLSKDKLRVDLQITDTQELFVSPRDQQPFAINYGVPLHDVSVPAIWEQTGVNGQRYIAYLDGRVEKVDEAQFSKMKLK